MENFNLQDLTAQELVAEYHNAQSKIGFRGGLPIGTEGDWETYTRISSEMDRRIQLSLDGNGETHFSPLTETHHAYTIPFADVTDEYVSGLLDRDLVSLHYRSGDWDEAGDLFITHDFRVYEMTGAEIKRRGIRHGIRHSVI